MKKTKFLIGIGILATILQNPINLVAITIDMVPQMEPVELTADQYIENIFGSNAKIAKAIILHESQNNLEAVGYNCFYAGKSSSCKDGDRKNAWSVDCGIGQINVKGKVCPEELLTLKGNMSAVERIYKSQGLNAWVSYKSGAYKKYL